MRDESRECRIESYRENIQYSIQPFNTKLTDGRTDERNDENYIRPAYEGYIFVTIRNLGIFLYPNKV